MVVIFIPQYLGRGSEKQACSSAPQVRALSSVMAPRPSVVIVGGGIGGLFAANALIAHGVRVSVYEQAPTLGEIGAGVYVTPNAVRHLERVGLGPAVDS